MRIQKAGPDQAPGLGGPHVCQAGPCDWGLRTPSLPTLFSPQPCEVCLLIYNGEDQGVLVLSPGSAGSLHGDSMYTSKHCYLGQTVVNILVVVLTILCFIPLQIKQSLNVIIWFSKKKHL